MAVPFWHSFGKTAPPFFIIAGRKAGVRERKKLPSNFLSYLSSRIEVGRVQIFSLEKRALDRESESHILFLAMPLTGCLRKSYFVSLDFNFCNDKTREWQEIMSTVPWG